MSGSRRRGGRRRRSDSEKGVGGQKSTCRTLTDPSTGQERTFDMAKTEERKEYMATLRQYREKAKQERASKGRPNKITVLVRQGKISEEQIWRHWDHLNEELTSPRTGGRYGRQARLKYLAAFIEGRTNEKVRPETVNEWLRETPKPKVFSLKDV